MAYDAAASLNETIRFLLAESKFHSSIPKSHVEFISKELSFLGSFLKTMRLSPSNPAVDVVMESRVRDAVLNLEALVMPMQLSLLLQMFHRSSIDYDDETFTFELSQHLSKLKQEISLFWEMLKTDEEYKRKEQQSCSNFKSATSNFVGKKKMVGMHDQLSRLKEIVMKESNTSIIISVTGMTGIGKTALVQEIYKDPLVVEHFDVYLFLSFGPQYKLKEIMLHALDQLGVHSDIFDENDCVEKLQCYVKESLSGRRYLVVLDDVWIDDLGFYELHTSILPQQKISSCAIVTTQKQNYVWFYSIDIRLMDDEESWDLLRETVFKTNEELCQPQLEKVGRKIAKKCEGLPLAIIHVGEMLSKTNRTVEEWEIIAELEDPVSIRTEDDTPLSNALSLSYNMLPDYLKECFLYMGVFPKKYEVRRTKLIQLWVSEAFFNRERKKAWKKLQENTWMNLLPIVVF